MGEVVGYSRRPRGAPLFPFGIESTAQPCCYNPCGSNNSCCPGVFRVSLFESEPQLSQQNRALFSTNLRGSNSKAVKKPRASSAVVLLKAFFSSSSCLLRNVHDNANEATNGFSYRTVVGMKIPRLGLFRRSPLISVKAVIIPKRGGK